MALPETRAKAEALLETLAFGVVEMKDWQCEQLLALARLGLEAAFPSEETRVRGCRAINAWRFPHMRADDATMCEVAGPLFDAALRSLTGEKQ